MKSSYADNILEIENMLKSSSETGEKDSIGKLYELVDTMYSHYLGLGSSPKNCITGGDDYLLDQLKPAFLKADSIDIIVSFIMESGARLILDYLKEAADRGARIRILTGGYLNITQPSALYLIKDALGDRVDLRFYKIENRSFHPKCYIFEYESEGDMFIGSSNISLSALTSGIEWNFRINSTKNEKDYSYFKQAFEELFNDCSIVMDDEELQRYSRSWKKPKVFGDMENAGEKSEDQCRIIQYPGPEPRGAQIEALYELKKSREEGFDRGLVVAATGIGKTYLAAFDSMSFDKILFVAHREEILKQARATFENVRRDKKCGEFYSGCRDRDFDILFASVQTLGKDEYLNEDYFKKDQFDYIIIDEFHHAAAGNYINIINYFTPKFLLGLTATPERLDNKDVFALCDYNVVYEVRLKDAINKGWLVPFRYYGIYDETNYDEISFRKGRYDEEELEKALMINKRADLILNHYKKYNSKRALGFCTSRNHAEYMAKHFNDNGIKACSVVSGESFENTMDRKEALSKLNSGDVNVIFSVDMFNEGLDVPSVDLVMFLRPTESPTVFLQQLGRGLRKSGGKKYLNVLDFIGNYKRADLIPFFLSGSGPQKGPASTGRMPGEDDYPDDCIVDFDFRLIDIFKRQRNQARNIQSIIYEEYLRIKEFLGHRPSRLEVFTYIDDDIYLNMKRNRKFNILNDYLGYLNEIGELDDEEKSLLGTKTHEFIKLIEITGMTKSYKMPLLLAFYNNGNLKLKVDEEDIYINFKEFYNKGSNGVDMTRHTSTANYKIWGKKEYNAISKKGPQHFFALSNSDFFRQDGKYFCINEKLEQYMDNQSFIRHFKDAIDYRTRRYYKERLEGKQVE